MKIFLVSFLSILLFTGCIGASVVFANRSSINTTTQSTEGSNSAVNDTSKSGSQTVYAEKTTPISTSVNTADGSASVDAPLEQK